MRGMEVPQDTSSRAHWRMSWYEAVDGWMDWIGVVRGWLDGWRWVRCMRGRDTDGQDRQIDIKLMNQTWVPHLAHLYFLRDCIELYHRLLQPHRLERTHILLHLCIYIKPTEGPSLTWLIFAFFELIYSCTIELYHRLLQPHPWIDYKYTVFHLYIEETEGPSLTWFIFAFFEVV